MHANLNAFSRDDAELILGYAVTPIGRSIYEQLVPLTDLATGWAASLLDEEY
ncbi:hypothetical protein V8J82_22545 [Gymnodinialimonas sp. 2305UL16-5]|uniref:hypothetical protein n=1 Tax=Gymnodinialimonas mytili TaxID=3126503 RepID=UPI0030B6D745